MGVLDIEFFEVGARVGLQKEREAISTAGKSTPIERSIAAGARRIKPTSLVNVARFPQMVDAEVVFAAIDPLSVRAHSNKTRGTAVAIVWAAARARAVHTSISGLGGCPLAPGAAVNVPSEDVVDMLERALIATATDAVQLIEASALPSGVIGRELPGMAAQAPRFPRATEAKDY